MRPRLLDLDGGTVLLDEEDFQRLGRAIYVGSNGYAYFFSANGTANTLHAFVMGGSRPGFHIDHIDGNRLDNRKSNLRFVSYQANQVNRKKPNRNNTSGIRGVQHVPHLSSRSPWRAQITVNRQNKHLGLFATCGEAVVARKAAERHYYGEVCP